MSQPHESEIDQLWAQYSKDDLWNRVSEWWESASRVRVVMIFALNHHESLSLDDILQKAGATEATVLKVLKELEGQGVIESRGVPAKYTIVNEPAFLKHMQFCCERTAVAATTLGSLAGWASDTK